MTYSVVSTIEAENPPPLARRTCRSSRCKAARAEDLGREIELRAPVRDDRAAEESGRPLVHLRGNLLGRAHEDIVAMDGELEVPLVVERHRRQLSQGVFAVEHPAVGARQQRVGDVADALVGGHTRPRRGTGSLNPLTLQIRGNLASHERAGARVLDANTSPWNLGRWIEERDALACRARVRRAARCASP